jgi:gliding motility-associated-like protein
VKTPGIYSVTSANPRGCEKSLKINVIEYPLPLTEFTAAPSLIDSKHNQITVTIPLENGASYTWDMGDGTTETGPSNQHNYNIMGDEKAFTITLTSTSMQGCVEKASTVIDVVPFIPNVFTPNGDGINDLFMPGLDIQIVDRNGFLLYRGTAGWDGNYQGRSLSPDTYFYLVHYMDRNNAEHTRKGYITLVR